MSYKLIGVLGGMGPAATVYFLDLLVKLVKASRDQEHARWVALCDPTIPDRSEAILRGGESPLKALVEGAMRLKSAGAEVLAMPCNTAHFWAEEVRDAVGLPMVSIVKATLKGVRTLGFRSALLLSTEATARSGLYQRLAPLFGVKLYLPGFEEQQGVNEVIRLVKAGDLSGAKRTLERLMPSLKEAYPFECAVGGCTEIPLVFDGRWAPFVDSSLELARAALALSRGEEVADLLV